MMRSASVALMIALAGCGRFGFQAASGPPGDGADDDDAPGDAIALRVLTDEYMSEPAGQPVAGATVVIERDGRVERAVTDARGSLQIAAQGVTACHVALKNELGWRVYTVHEPRPGALELGGRPAPSLNHTMTITVPDNGSDDFTVHVVEHCAFPPFSGPQVMFSYSTDCEGVPSRAIVYGRGAGVINYLDAGQVTLANGAMRTVSGNYAPVPTASVAVSNLEVGFVNDVLFEVFARNGIDLLPLTINFPSAMPTGTTTTVSGPTVPGGDTYEVQLTADLPLQYSSTSVRMLPLPATGTPTLDATTMVPLFRSLVLTHPPSVSWTGGGTGGTIVVVETVTGPVQWDAYLPPTATEVAFPPLPADLGVPVPTSFDFATVTKLDVPGLTTAAALPTIDRTWSQWPHVPTLLPAGGSALARILYTIGLGPPATGLTAPAAAGGSQPAFVDRARAAATGWTARVRPAARGAARSPPRTARSAE